MRRFVFSLSLTAALLLSSVALSAQTKKILVFGNQSPEVIKDWQSASSKVKLVPVSKVDVMQEIADADALIGNVTPELVRAGKKLQWVQITSAGAERVLFLSGSNDLRDSDIVLTNNQIVQGPEIADHAMAMLLAMSRNLLMYIEDRKVENWRRERFTGIELRGKTAVVIGVGGIGTQIATRAWAFGMKVIGVDPEDIPYIPFLEKVVKPDQINEVLAEADVVFMSAPHTPMSNKMLGPDQFEAMKKGAYFIAVSRGGTYDLNSLVKALDSQRLKGAGVDVVDPEPLPAGHALWKFNNVIITPHIAGRSDMDTGRMLGTVKANIARFADGKPLINVVEKQRGW
jgi:phosphoglycerate dehydrogenase-like enzyme